MTDIVTDPTRCAGCGRSAPFVTLAPTAAGKVRLCTACLRVNQEGAGGDGEDQRMRAAGAPSLPGMDD